MRRRDWLTSTASSAAAVLVPGSSAVAAAPVTAGVQGSDQGSDFLVGLGLSINDKPMTRAITLAAGLGAQSIRIDIPWSRVEAADGQLRVPAEYDAMVNQCVSSNVQPLLILAYGHPRYGGDKPTSAEAVNAFGRYAAFVVRHFKGRVRLYDVWNEWNTHTGKTRPGSPEDYIALATSVHRAAKAVDPTVLLLSGGISDLGIGKGWVERFLSLGGQQWVDGLSIHPYNWFYRQQRTPEAAFRLVDELTGQLDAVGATRMPIYVTEIGWPNFTGRHGRTDVEVESYLSRFMLLAASRPRIAGVWWYCLRDQGEDRTNKEHRFGLLDFNYNRKPIAGQFESVAKLIQTQGRPVLQTASDAYRLQWRKAGAPAIEWRPQGEAAVKINGLGKADR